MGKTENAVAVQNEKSPWNGRGFQGSKRMVRRLLKGDRGRKCEESWIEAKRRREREKFKVDVCASKTCPKICLSYF